MHFMELWVTTWRQLKNPNLIDHTFNQPGNGPICMWVFKEISRPLSTLQSNMFWSYRNKSNSCLILRGWVSKNSSRLQSNDLGKGSARLMCPQNHTTHTRSVLWLFRVTPPLPLPHPQATDRHVLISLRISMQPSPSCVPPTIARMNASPSLIQSSVDTSLALSASVSFSPVLLPLTSTYQKELLKMSTWLCEFPMWKQSFKDTWSHKRQAHPASSFGTLCLSHVNDIIQCLSFSFHSA